MARNKREAAQMRASQIRTLKMMQARAWLIDDRWERQIVMAAIDKQLASMRAGAPYKITEADVKRYTRY